MLTSLDPHSSYLNPKDFQDMQVQTRGEFGGLGIEVTMEDGLIKVVSPIDDTPAFRAGVQPGDIITHLDGEPVLGLTLAEAVDKMRGPANTEIKLTIRRANKEPFDLVVKRDVIRVESVRARAIEDVGYIRITSFTEQTDEGTQEGRRQGAPGARRHHEGPDRRPAQQSGWAARSGDRGQRRVSRQGRDRVHARPQQRGRAAQQPRSRAISPRVFPSSC